MSPREAAARALYLLAELAAVVKHIVDRFPEPGWEITFDAEAPPCDPRELDAAIADFLLDLVEGDSGGPAPPAGKRRGRGRRPAAGREQAEADQGREV